MQTCYNIPASYVFFSNALIYARSPIPDLVCYAYKRG
jgi:hypothetical protein